MAVIEETRKAIQDFLAPEIREIKGRLEAIEKRQDSDKAELLRSIATTETNLVRAMEITKTDLLRAIDASVRHIDSRISDLMETTRIRERLAVLESKQAN